MSPWDLCIAGISWDWVQTFVLNRHEFFLYFLLLNVSCLNNIGRKIGLVSLTRRTVSNDTPSRAKKYDAPATDSIATTNSGCCPQISSVGFEFLPVCPWCLKIRQVRFVSVKAERPNHPSRSHARQGGGVSQWVLHDNDNDTDDTYMTQ